MGTIYNRWVSIAAVIYQPVDWLFSICALQIICRMPRSGSCNRKLILPWLDQKLATYIYNTVYMIESLKYLLPFLLQLEVAGCSLFQCAACLVIMILYYYIIYNMKSSLDYIYTDIEIKFNF